jgi:hypothetical protein
MCGTGGTVGQFSRVLPSKINKVSEGLKWRVGARDDHIERIPVACNREKLPKCVGNLRVHKGNEDQRGVGRREKCVSVGLGSDNGFNGGGPRGVRFIRNHEGDSQDFWQFGVKYPGSEVPERSSF